MSFFHNNALAGASGQGGGAGAYEISRSVRFNSADSAYLSRTPASAGNRKTWTWSGWVKRSGLGAFQYVFGNADATAQNGFFLRFTDTDAIGLADWTASAVWSKVTSQVFRDPSAWYHILVSYDTTNATAANRVRLYVNGALVTTFSTTTDPSLNYDGYINNTNPVSLGRWGQYSAFYLSSCLADVHFIDGQALDPTSFGEFDTNGVWQPKAYSGGSYGTNGFHLDFSDNSTAAALGTDTSGNGNTWTVNNISVTAGAGNDSLVDSPTNYGSDTGAGGEVRGNYCTLNGAAIGTDATLSNGNLDISYGTSATILATMGTIGMSSGKWYWEVTVTAHSGSPAQMMLGITNTSVTAQADKYPGRNATGWSYYGETGYKYHNGSGSSYGATYAVNDVISFAFDADAGSITAYKNGVSQGVMFSGLATGTYFPAVGDPSTASTFSAAFNFGQRPFAYTAPSGFKALCTTNLPAPTIENGSDYFDALTYTGITQSPRTITGLDFTPSFVWVKNRSISSGHYLWDAVRGTDKNLRSDGTFDEAAVSAAANGIISTSTTGGFIVKNGITTGTNVGSAGSDAYVAWAWDAGSSTVTNNDGTISSQVRANASAGFSIVTYTGNGSAGATVGHGLGVAPSFYFLKCRSTATNWPIYHAGLSNPEQKILLLDSTSAEIDITTYWNDTAPTSSVFSLGTDVNANGNTATFVAYCFAPVEGYSAFGSYVGNGSTDGPMVYTGFRPKLVLIKRSTGTSNWWIWDSERADYNVTELNLKPNTTGVEDAIPDIDILSNGFKIRQSTINNSSGETYIYAAFAEHPFQTSRAR